MSQYTELKGRLLWYDGDTSCTPSSIMKWVGKIPDGKLYTTTIDSQIKQYNALVDKPQKICVKDELKPLSFDWTLPEPYASLDVQQHVLNCLSVFDYDDTEMTKRITRVLREIKLFKKYGYLDVLRCLIYIVDQLEANDQVWGVGRGSSVSSYVLYLIGVHEIDSVAYNLPFDDFLKHTD